MSQYDSFQIASKVGTKVALEGGTSRGGDCGRKSSSSSSSTGHFYMTSSYHAMRSSLLIHICIKSGDRVKRRETFHPDGAVTFSSRVQLASPAAALGPQEIGWAVLLISVSPPAPKRSTTWSLNPYCIWTEEWGKGRLAFHMPNLAAPAQPSPE